VKSIEYLAGLFDGEGSFSIQVGLRHYKDGSPSGWVNPSMSVNLYYGDEVLDHFVAAFGGQIYAYKKGGRRWHLGTRDAARVAAVALEPHLEIKRDIARRFIQALDLCPTVGRGGGANRRAGERVWSPQQVIDVAEIALTLNPARSRRCNKTVEYITELKGALT
jgi:hypothetical protein